jgi:PAS domain S-box-containing protein
VSALETIADLIARAIEKARLYQRTSSLRELNENIIATMPSALLVLDENLNVVLANTAYYKLANLEKDEVEGKDIRDLWDEEFLKDSRLLACLRETLQTGKSSELKNIRHYWPGRYVMLNFGMSCIPAGEQPRVVLMIEDVTETVERAFRLSMLREMNEAIQSTLELDKILRLVLTCVTAGHALAFNRGFLFMVNKRRNLIEGTTGIGPVSLEDARNIYSDSALKTKSLQQLLSECDFSVPKEDLPLYDLARKMSFRLDEDDEIVIRTIKEKKTFLVLDAENDERVSSRCRAMLGANSFVSVPLVAKDEAIGVIVADNIYSGHPITPERAELLALFANHAGLAIENGESYARLQKEIKERIEAYQRLEEIQEREVRTGQLAAIGEMAARVAHEIRNPLVNIGLLARQILRSVSSGDHRHDKADVIVNEVMRLEKILTDVVDFSRPATPNKLPMSIDAVVDQVTGFVRPQLKDRNIQLVRAQKTPVPQIAADPAQIKQALLNIVKNAIEAVEQNGTITINTWCDGRTVAVDVVDTGPGIVDYVLENMYDLFYTTKQGGSGLGLAITRKIIEDHRGSLSVQSTPGEGTTFTVQLPVQAESENWPPAQASIQGGPQL